MTNEEILKKALLKAYPDKKFKNQKSLEQIYRLGLLIRDRGFAIIFYHPFAKAFWKSNLMYCCPKHSNYLSDRQQRCGLCGSDFILTWQHHLQQMVLEEEPLKYLEKFLEEKK